MGISYATNENLRQNGFVEQPGAHRDVARLRKLLTGTVSLYFVTSHTDQLTAQYGYKNENITVLVDDDARPRDKWPTYENIVSVVIAFAHQPCADCSTDTSYGGSSRRVQARGPYLLFM